MTRPGEFGVAAAADQRRGVFDYHNEAFLAYHLPINAVFIGDSITDMWGLDAFFQGTRGFVVNRGIGGDRSPFVRRRFEADVVQLHPRLVVINIGINNTWDLDQWEPGKRREASEIEAEITGDVEAMLEMAGKAGIATALCSILPVNMPVNGNTAARNALVARVNERLQALATGHGAAYVDYHSHLTGEDGLTLRPDLADDGLHPHVATYAIMARVLLESLSQAGITAISQRAVPA
jgi:lysophospholipase L1-like esterase